LLHRCVAALDPLAHEAAAAHDLHADGRTRRVGLRLRRHSIEEHCSSESNGRRKAHVHRKRMLVSRMRTRQPFNFSNFPPCSADKSNSSELGLFSLESLETQPLRSHALDILIKRIDLLFPPRGFRLAPIGFAHLVERLLDR